MLICDKCAAPVGPQGRLVVRIDSNPNEPANSAAGLVGTIDLCLEHAGELNRKLKDALNGMKVVQTPKTKDAAAALKQIIEGGAS